MGIANSDGSIILSTKVDTSGMEQGTKSLKSQAAKLAAEYRKAGMSQSEALKKAWSEIERTRKETEKATKSTQTYGKKAKTAFQGVGSALKSLAGYLALTFSVAKIIQFGEEAINLASDLQEVQNVVDTAFGNMSYKIEDFSKTSIEQFGLSGLAAKQWASTMMAMGSGMGQAMSVGSDMAVELTGRLADVMSFYNKTEEEAFTLGKAIYSGETEPLKSIGIIMTENNLSLFAMSKGYQQAYKDMNAANKLLVRQQFFLEQTSLAAGDYTKTADGWANQTRTLSQRWKEMQAVFGETFIAFGVLVLPVINAIIDGLKQIAIMFKAAAASFGLFKEETKTSENSTINISNQSDKTAENIEEQAKNQKSLNKELKKTTAQFDDLQILTSGANSEEDNISNTIQNSVDSITGLSGESSTSGFDAMGIAKNIEEALDYLLPVIELGLVAIGLIILSTGNIPFGIGFIAAGAYLYSVTERSEGLFDVNVIKQDLQVLIDWIEEILVTIGIILLLLGQVPWGIGFILAGAIVYGVKEITSKEYDTANFEEKLAVMVEAVSTALIAIGVFLILFGHIPLGIGFLVVGKKLLDVTEEKLQEGVAQTKLQKFFEDNQKLFVGIGLALVVLGLLLLFTPVSFPIALGLIAAGAGALAAESSINGTKIVDDIKKILFENPMLISLISGGLLILGIILCVTGVGLPLGIALIAAGAVGLATEVALNWDTIKEKVSNAFDAVVNWVKTYGLLVLGILLCLTGLSIPFGIALILKWVKEGGENGVPLATVIVDKVKEIWGKIKSFWNAHIAKIFTAKWWSDLAKKALNGLIDVFEKMLNHIINKINVFLKGIDSVVSAVGDVFGADWSVATIPNVKIPRLAQGAVIPPNREFLAVLGDQKHGTNIEAPLQTIVDAFNIALAQNGNTGGGNTEVVLEIDGREFGRAVVEQGNRENRRIGTRLVMV